MVRGLILSLAVVCCYGPAHAAITSNAITSNAITSNSLTTNAITSNGLAVNAFDQNAITAGDVALSGRRVIAIDLPAAK